MNENQNIEFKSSWRDEYLKVIAAFANAEGGKLYLGIDDNGNTIGISNLKKVLEDIPNKIKNKLWITPFVSTQIKDGKEIIAIDIMPTNFPVFLEGKIFFRSGSTVQELSGLELTAFLLQKTGQTWDSLPTDASLKELDESTIEIFRRLAKDRLPMVMQEPTHQLIEKLNLAASNKKLTRAGLLLFGKNPERFFISSITRIGRFKTDCEILDTIESKGNLFQQLETTTNVIKKHINVKFNTAVDNLTIESFSRKEIWDYPLDAIREAVINSLVHRDYIDSSPIQIKIYDDKLIFWNPGKLIPPLTVQSLKEYHPGKQRNPLLASVFYYAGLIESWGSGTLKMIKLCKEYNLPEPQFIERQEGIGDFRVIFYKDIYSEEYLQKIGLNERQIKAILYVKEKGKLTNTEYQKIAAVSKSTATRDLVMLVEKNILEQQGTTGKGTFYVLKKSS